MKYILFIVIPLNGLSQNHTSEEQLQIDYINKVINDPNAADTTIVKAYLNLSEIFYSTNLDTVFFLGEKVEKIVNDKLKVKQSENVRNSLKQSLSDALNNIGYVYRNRGDIQKALKYYYESLKISEENNSQREIATTLNNIASIYYYLDDIPKALEYYLRSLEIKRQIGDKDGISYSLNNIGIIYYREAKKNDSLIKDSLISVSLKYLFESLKIREELGNKHAVAGSLNNIGVIHKDQGDLSKALDFYNQSLKIREDFFDKKGVGSSLNSIGLVYLMMGRISDAKKYALQSFNIAKELGFPINIQDAAELLSNIYEKEGKGLEALEMYKLSISMRDTINNEVLQKESAQQQAKYEYERQRAVDDAEHEKQIAIEQEAKAKQKVITYATAGGLGLVVIFLVFVFNRLQVTKKQKIVIETQKLEVEQQKEEVELAHYELEEKNQEILDSITYAKRIQNAILPPLKEVKKYLQESFILYKPKDIVAGDFYWLEHKDGKVLFAAADCTGHGVPGAMVSVVCNNGLNRSVREYDLTDPGKILNKTREIVIQEFEKSEDEVKDGMDIALCSLEGNTLKYAGANNPLWIIRNNEIIETKADKQPIGKFDELLPYTTHIFELQQGDSIYIFSDGYVDQFGGEKGKKFKAQALRELLLSVQGESMEKQQLIINQTFENWKGNLEQIDDVCIIGVRI